MAGEEGEEATMSDPRIAIVQSWLTETWQDFEDDIRVDANISTLLYRLDAVRDEAGGPDLPPIGEVVLGIHLYGERVREYKRVDETHWQRMIDQVGWSYEEPPRCWAPMPQFREVKR